MRTKKIKKIVKPAKDAVSYETGGGWGDVLNYIKYPNSVSGHKPRKPKTGDVLLAKMQSGKTLVSIFQTVEYCGDPPDIFFGTVEPVGYTDEVEFQIPEKYVHRGLWR